MNVFKRKGMHRLTKLWKYKTVRVVLCYGCEICWKEGHKKDFELCTWRGQMGLGTQKFLELLIEENYNGLAMWKNARRKNSPMGKYL